jgi:hypothetical protein
MTPSSLVFNSTTRIAFSTAQPKRPTSQAALARQSGDFKMKNHSVCRLNQFDKRAQSSERALWMLAFAACVEARAAQMVQINMPIELQTSITPYIIELQ